MNNYKKWKILIPDRPFKLSETIYDWNILNINFDDSTICSLCGKKEDCICFDDYYCEKCNKKNINCNCFES